MANGSMHGLSFHTEATYGAGPGATPTMTPIRHTSCSLALTKDYFQSEEIRSDRQITDGTGGTRKVGGDIGIELSYGSYDTILEALLGGTWNTNVLKAGTTRRSWCIERLYDDATAGAKKYHRFLGCEFDKLAVTIASNAMVKGTLSVVGQDLDLDTAIITGETYGDPTTTTPFSSFSGTLEEGGSGIGIVTELSFTIENGLAPRFVVSDPLTLLPSWGRSHVGGSMTTYFDDADLLEKFIDETESSISIELTDAATNSLTILIPRIKYTGGQPDVSGEGPITIALPFEAYYDSAEEESNITITRAPVA
jgi:hypothetical protein